MFSPPLVATVTTRNDGDAVAVADETTSAADRDADPDSSERTCARTDGEAAATDAVDELFAVTTSEASESDSREGSLPDGDAADQ